MPALLYIALTADTVINSTRHYTIHVYVLSRTCTWSDAVDKIYCVYGGARNVMPSRCICISSTGLLRHRLTAVVFQVLQFCLVLTTFQFSFCRF